MPPTPLLDAFESVCQDATPEGSGGGELLPLLVRFPSRGASVSEGGVVAPRTLIEVSDLYRGRCGGSVSVSLCLTPVSVERDRLRPSVDAAGVVGVAGKGEVGGTVAPKPGGAVEVGDVIARNRR